MLKKIVLLLVCVLAITMIFAFDLLHFFSLDQFFAHKAALQQLVDDYAVLSKSLYFVTYVIVFAFALPAGAIMTLAGGALFGWGWGVILVSFASSLGSLLSFLVARFMLRDWVRNKFRQRIDLVDQGVADQGAFYLFALRLVPILPPAVINLAMGVTGMRAWTFYWVSQIGMLAGTVVYVNAGTELGNLNESEPIINARLLMAFVALAVFPLLIKKLLRYFELRKRYTAFKKPKQFDNTLLVIGAGSGGLVSAYIAAMLRAKVTLIEKNKMGGDCLNTGCVPSKALLRTASVAQTVRLANDFGVVCDSPKVDFSAVMRHVRNAIAEVEPHDSIERYTALGVHCITGSAKLISPWEVDVDGQVISAKKIIVATGATPKNLDIPGEKSAPVFNSDTLWQLEELPKKLVVLGAGAIGCELAQAFARLGSEVTLVTHGSRLLSKEDVCVSNVLLGCFQKENIDVRFGFNVSRIEARNQNVPYGLMGDVGGSESEIGFSHLLVAVGRQPNFSGFGLETLGIGGNATGGIDVDEYLQTYLPNIYAVGDVTNRHVFTHAASHQAWYATVNALFGKLKRFKVDYRLIPRATFTDPEVAHVGLTESEAKAQGLSYEVTRYALSDLDRAIADGKTNGFVQVITPQGKDKILGVTIVGNHASDVISEYVSVMKRNGRLGDIMNTIHIYPTYAEMNKYAAGEWKKSHKPEWILSLLEKFLSP